MQNMFGTIDVHDVFFARCKADGWSARARTCFAGTTSYVKLTCTGDLTSIQTQALTADVMQVMKHTEVTIKVPPSPPHPLDGTAHATVLRARKRMSCQRCLGLRSLKSEV